MKTYWIGLFCLSILTFSHCKKDAAPKCLGGLQEATIIGQDFRRCACCGGWFIDLGQDTVRTFVLPQDFEIDAVPDLPVEVCLSYTEELGACKDFAKLIVVDQVVKR